MTDLPQLKRDDVTLLFHWHYYDGPLEGALEWDGRRYWFAAFTEDHDDLDDFGQVLRLMDLPVCTGSPVLVCNNVPTWTDESWNLYLRDGDHSGWRSVDQTVFALCPAGSTYPECGDSR